MFLEAYFFAFEKNFFRVSVQNLGHCRLHEIIGLQLSQCLSANHNPELRCVIGNTMFTVQIYNRLKDIKGSSLPFGGVSIVAIGDLFQLQPVNLQIKTIKYKKKKKKTTTSHGWLYI